MALPVRIARLISGVVFKLTLLWCCAATAQETAAPPKPTPPPTETAAGTAPAPIEEFKPPLYLLKDKDGNLQPVPGFTLEDFNELYELKHLLQQPEQTPDYSLQSVKATGRIVGGHAELTVEFRVLVRDEQCRVPLRLNRAALRGEAQYEGPGSQLLHFEENGEGYVSWMRGGRDKQHQLTLQLLVPVATIGEESRLRLRWPPATMSELKLTVPVADAVGTVNDPATLLPPAATADKKTELTVLGLGGSFELAWRKRGSRHSETSPALDVVGEVAATIDGGVVSTRLDLTVRGYGGQFDRFQVRLPEGATLQPDRASGYTLVPLKDRLVEVRLPAMKSEEHVALAFSQTHDMEKPDEWFELAGFEVIGAARHRGHIAISVIGDWHVLWGPTRAVRQVDELPKSLKVDDLVAGFEYFSQPCSLRARLAPKKTRVGVEPEYRLLVGAKQVRLEATLDFNVRGAKVSALRVELPDWNLDEVGPENLVIADAVATTAAGAISIPLKQPSLGHVAVTILAHRDIPPGATSLSLSLPRRPQVDSPGPPAVVVLPAAVVVLPDDNVELTPDEKAMVGLLRQQVSPRMELPKRQQAPLFYRGETANPMFSSGFRIHQQAITVDSNCWVAIGQQSMDVEQRLMYTVAYEALGNVALRVPRGLVGLDGVTFEIDGQPVLPVVAPGADAEPGESTSVPMSIALPEPRIGDFELILRYQVPTEKLLPKRSVLREINLAMPADGRLAGNTLYVTAAPGIEPRFREGPWALDKPSPGRAGRHGGLQLSATEPADRVVLAVHMEDAELGGSTVVERAWVQTWLHRSARQDQSVRADRAVYRFVSGRKEFSVTLPEGAVADQTQVLLDGKPVALEIDSDGRLTVPLPDNGARKPSGDERRHVLELGYQFPGDRVRQGPLALALPELEPDVWVRRMLWQLVLPRDEHVILSPEGFTCEFKWGWEGIFWGRTPLWGQADLESWVGAGHRTELPEATNRYVFSTLGGAGSARLQTAGRSRIVLVASLAALVAGLLLIYVPASRHPASLFTVAVALAAAAVLYPEPTLLVSQAASLGLALTLLAGLLERTVARRHRGPAAYRSSSSILGRDSTQTQFEPPVAGDRASTQTVAALAPASTSDSSA